MLIYYTRSESYEEVSIAILQFRLKIPPQRFLQSPLLPNQTVEPQIAKRNLAARYLAGPVRDMAVVSGTRTGKRQSGGDVQRRRDVTRHRNCMRNCDRNDIRKLRTNPSLRNLHLLTVSSQLDYSKSLPVFEALLFKHQNNVLSSNRWILMHLMIKCRVVSHGFIYKFLSQLYTQIQIIISV